MAAENRIVTVVIVEHITIEVISCERGGTEFYFWRIIEDGRIEFTDASLWDNAGVALDKAMEKVLPDLGIAVLPEPDATDFEMLNMLLLWNAPDGPVSTLYEAVKWHDTLVKGREKLLAAAVAADRAIEIALTVAAGSTDVDSDEYAEIFALKDLMKNQFELAHHCNDREIMTLASFIENFLGKRG
jgi:hypothetical protein